MTKKRDDVSTTSAAYDLMRPRWALISHLLGGTESMRAAGEEYLPRHVEETSRQYANRLKVSTLANYTELTLEQMVGRVFAKPINANEDVPEAIASLLDDVDGHGNDLTTFSRKWFRTSLAYAFSHVLIDYPEAAVATNPDGTPRPLSQAEAVQQGRRPYWRFICPENLFFASADHINGIEVLTHVRILEQEVIRDGFAEVIVDRIRVIEPGRWSTYIKNSKGKWVPEAEGTYSLPFIPLVTFYTDRSGLMMGKPPLTDLAHLNITHWQSSSDQRNVLTVSRFPMLAVSGALGENENGTLTVGPNQWLHSPDPQAKFYYVEHTGAAIAAGVSDLERLEEQMAAYGAAFLKRDPGNKTATARALDSAESISSLEAMAIDFKSALEQALAITAQWMGIKPEYAGTIAMSTTLDEGSGAEGDLDALHKARAMGDISRKTYLLELRRRGVISEDVDVNKELEIVGEEGIKTTNV